MKYIIQFLIFIQSKFKRKYITIQRGKKIISMTTEDKFNLPVDKWIKEKYPSWTIIKDTRKK